MKMMRIGVLIMVLLALPVGAVRAGDIALISLHGTNEHAGSKVWSGKFRAPNGRDYNAGEFYKSRKPEFSATGIFMLNGQKRVSFLLPVSLDAGYDAELYQAEPLASLGFGAAITLTRQSVLSLRVDNLFVAGGDVSEKPCYDGYRRRYHCGSGLAWTDFENIDIDQRGRLAVPAFYARYVARFSF